MSLFSRRTRRKGVIKKTAYSILAILMLTIIGAGVWALATYCEWENPQILADKGIAVIGQRKIMDLRFLDKKSGLREILVSLKQGEKEQELSRITLNTRGTKDKALRLEVIPKNLGLRDGEATLRISVTDFSLLHNKQVVEMKAKIDAVPPRITLLSTAHNINPGGTCLSIFKLTKTVAFAGVRCGGETFPAFPMIIKNTPCYVSYFAIPIDVTIATPMKVVTMDMGGNEASTRIPFYIRTQHRFRSDTVNLGDDFLTSKAAEFQEQDTRLAGKQPAEIFSMINSQMRAENTKTIAETSRKTQPRQLWDGLFLRMKNAAPMALFGDKRGYSVGGTLLGNSVHMGVDLASTEHAPIEAANNGIVIYADRLGIYGNAVIIDHGLGISTLYGHLSDIKVMNGQQVSKGAIIGLSGNTGLAGGDHLHYSVMVYGCFVNPIEWWDSNWMKDNIELKFKDAANLI